MLLKRQIKIFCSYSHLDEKLREKIEDYLVSLRREGLVTIWNDRCIQAGDDREQAIDKNLEASDIVLLLISNDFLNSDYCFNIEMTRALQRRRENQIRVIAVILRHCDWEHAKVGDGAEKIALRDLPAIPTCPEQNNRLVPVMSWDNDDEAFTAVAEAIRKTVEEMTGGKTVEQTRTQSSHERLPPEVPDLLPHMCDRARQEQALVDSIRDWHEPGKAKRPLVCIIHGHVSECHEMYQRRLTEETFPRLLRIKAETETSVSYSPNQPLSIDTFFVPLQRYHSRVKHPFDFLRSELGQVVVDDVDAKPDKIVEAISQYKKPMMFFSYLGSFDWIPDGPKIVKSYLRFWNALPEIASGPPVICCLFFKYNEHSSADKNTAARDYLNSLSASLSSYRKVRPVVLDELPPINYGDVDNWIKDGRHFRNLCPAHTRSFCDVPKATQSINLLFSTPEAQARAGWLPMQFIAPKLMEVIKENRCRKE